MDNKKEYKKPVIIEHKHIVFETIVSGNLPYINGTNEDGEPAFLWNLS